MNTLRGRPGWTNCWLTYSKNKWAYRRRFATREQAIAEITEWIEIVDNRQRREARSGYLSPAADAEQFYRNQRAA